MVATSVFMIYVTDAMGYMGSVGILLYKNFGAAQRTWLEFYQDAAVATATVGIAGFVASMIYFMRRLPRGAETSARGVLSGRG